MALQVSFGTPSSSPNVSVFPPANRHSFPSHPNHTATSGSTNTPLTATAGAPSAMRNRKSPPGDRSPISSSFGCAQEQPSRRVRVQAENLLRPIRQPGRDPLEAIVSKARQSAAGDDPKLSVEALAHAADLQGRQAFFDRKALEAVAVVAEQPVRGFDPQESIPILQQPVHSRREPFVRPVVLEIVTIGEAWGEQKRQTGQQPAPPRELATNFRH